MQKQKKNQKTQSGMPRAWAWLPSELEAASQWLAFGFRFLIYKMEGLSQMHSRVVSGFGNFDSKILGI